MAEPGLLARWFGRSAPAAPANLASPVATGSGGSGASAGSLDAAIPPSWPAEWWQRGMRPYASGEPATVNACANAYAQTIAQLPGTHYRLDGEDNPIKVTTSALSRILRNPNTYQTRSDFLVNLVSDLMFAGNAYAWAERNARQEVTALHLMPARQAAPYVEPETRAIFYGLGRNPLAGEIDYLAPQRDVLHVRGRCRPGQPLRGISPLEWSISARAANTAISDTQARFFAQASQPSGVLSTDQQMNRDQMERLREAWRAHSAGVHAGEVPVLSGNLKWVPMGMTATDAQLVDTFNLTIADIARAFGVPLPIIGDLTAATLRNVEQLVELWLAQGLGYWVEHIEVAFDKFFGLPDGEYTELDTDVLLRTAFKERIDGLTTAITGGLYSPNEARKKEGLGKVAFGAEPRVQAQVVPLSQVGKQPSAPSAPAPGNPINPAADGSPPPSNDNAPAGADATPAGAKGAGELETRLGDALAVQGAAIVAQVAELIEARAQANPGPAPPPELSSDPVAAAAELRGNITEARRAIR
jgi:HK97 family phage portal protein